MKYSFLAIPRSDIIHQTLDNACLFLPNLNNLNFGSVMLMHLAYEPLICLSYIITLFFILFLLISENLFCDFYVITLFYYFISHILHKWALRTYTENASINVFNLFNLQYSVGIHNVLSTWRKSSALSIKQCNCQKLKHDTNSIERNLMSSYIPPPNLKNNVTIDN